MLSNDKEYTSFLVIGVTKLTVRSLCNSLKIICDKVTFLTRILYIVRVCGKVDRRGHSS